MNAEAPPTPAKSVFVRRQLDYFQKETGESLNIWALIALLNFVTQIVFRRELAPGEFGTLNTALAIIGMMTVPLAAAPQAFAWYLARKHPVERHECVEALRASRFLVTETLAWAWGALSVVLLFVIFPLLYLPRFSLDLFTLLNVLIAAGGLIGAVVCQSSGQVRLWGWLLVATALTRLILGAGLSAVEPWAESGLAVFLLAGCITLAPALRERSTEIAARLQALRAVLDHDFLLYAGATFSVLLGNFLFVNADRIVAQSWFGWSINNNMGYVDWPMFDAYQTAGLLGRALLWGTQPLLLVLFAHRSCLDKTTAASLKFFWIYLGALVGGAILLGIFRGPLSWLFCGSHFAVTSMFTLNFAAVMVPLGLLQALGYFALASRRFHECFVLGGGGVGYTLLLYLVGRQPELMLSYMFGGGLVLLMLVLFIGVVRWGRKQP